MDANDRNLGAIFDLNIRLVAPLFQRPYVWKREENWEPLWDSICETAERRASADSTRPHFLGAVVLEQVKTATGEVEARQVIDGQQRLATLQVLLATIRDVCRARGSNAYYEAFKRLTENYVAAKKSPDSIYKVWPTNYDRQHFCNVMTAGSLEELRKTYGARPGAQDLGNLIPNAYVFFHQSILDWLGNTDGEALEERLKILETTLRQDLVLVVIDLGEKDDAQAIFETLNALGTPLLPADLVKNFLFRRGEAEGLEVEQPYNLYWKSIDEQSSYWRKEVRQGRLNRPRVDIFLQHYLTLKTEGDVGTTHLFPTFKKYVYSDLTKKADEHIRMFREYADVYHSFDQYANESREGMFFYRLDQLDTHTVEPVLLEVFNQQEPREDKEQILNDVESYLVRRAICALTSKAYNRIFVDLIKRLSRAEFSASEIRSFLLKREGETGRWPTDDEVREALLNQALYNKVSRACLRMVLEAIEIELRREDNKTEKMRLPEKLTIEHIMPRKWREHWPLLNPTWEEAAKMRDEILDRIGNLTLVTKRLNPALSNGPWETKKQALLEHSILKMNLKLQSTNEWDESGILRRGLEVVDLVKKIWPRPTI